MHWQLPPGVSPGTWDYVRSRTIAADYDQFLQDDPLTRFDWQIIQRYLPKLVPADLSQTVIEFGCGNGRTLLPLIRNGYRAVGVDLSTPMLLEMRRKFEAEKKISEAQPSVSPESFSAKDCLVSLRANLVELDGIANDSVDHGVCLFSTLGMIRGHQHRVNFLRHCRRILRRNGLFILHAHHLWNQLRHPGAMRWLVGHAWRVVRGREEFGDRFASYRGVQNMFIHSFRKRELARLLKDSGFDPQHWHAYVPTSNESGAPSQQGSLQQGSAKPVSAQPGGVVGWVVVCRCAN